MNLSDYVDAACRASGLSLEIILSRQRRGAHWRHAAMKLARDAGFSAVRIGYAFEKDHTTVLYADKVAKPEFVAAVDAALRARKIPA